MTCLALLFFYINVINARCNVSDIAVQHDFDIKRYTEMTWYEQKLIDTTFPLEDLYPDYQHVYYLHPDAKTISLYANGRNPHNLNECIYYTRELRTTDIPGKWLIRGENDTHPLFNDYWIISTDYESYSVVYTCLEKNSIGECVESNAWIFSRTPQLSNDKLTFAESILESLCINISALLVTRQTNECPVDKNCAIYTIEKKRMQNFNIQRFVGKWYITSYLPVSVIHEIDGYKDYQHYYAPDSNGTLLTVFARGRMHNDTENCVYSQGQLLPTPESGKFMHRRRINSTSFQTTDFWIISTDNIYVNYAIVFGCRQTDSVGVCTHQDSWILSRYKAVSDNQRPIVDRKLQELCLNSSDFIPMNQIFECPETRDCSVATIVQRMMRNFDLEKSKGKWYKHSYLPSALDEPVSDYEMIVSESTETSDSHFAFIKLIRARYPNKDNNCNYEDLEVRRRKTDSPGKQVTTHKSPAGEIQVTSYVLATDYTSYLVEYSCQAQDEHFKCVTPAACIWCRSQDLTLEQLANAKEAVISVCLDYDKFIKVEHSNPCPDPVISKGSVITKGYILTIILMIAIVN